ncbi:MAG TPA: OmpH family outer membrane protein [Chthonomonadaceae bacterium]|nr:OmpH family outer membrane protein [Chthonomonadaceae bacterium]
MSAPTPSLRLVVLALVTLCIVASLAGAKGQDKNVLKIAVVNPGKLLTEYKFTIKSDADLKTKQNDVLTELNSWDQHRLLSEADQKTLSQIAIKENNKQALAAAEMATKQRLEETYKRVFDEFLSLQGKQQPNQAEQDRLKELNRMELDTSKRIKERQQAAQDDLQKQAAAVREKMDSDVRTNIIEVAKQKGYNLVFSSEVVLFCDNDLTDEVLKKLNKGQ